MLAHTVLFSLNEKTPKATQQLVAACRKYLTQQPGIVFFAVGPRAGDIEWSITDADFDVMLQIVFDSKDAHDEYQESPEHTQFLEETEPLFDSVRVLDAYVES